MTRRLREWGTRNGGSTWVTPVLRFVGDDGGLDGGRNRIADGGVARDVDAEFAVRGERSVGVVDGAHVDGLGTQALVGDHRLGVDVEAGGT